MTWGHSIPNVLPGNYFTTLGPSVLPSYYAWTQCTDSAGCLCTADCSSPCLLLEALPAPPSSTTSPPPPPCTTQHQHHPVSTTTSFLQQCLVQTHRQTASRGCRRRSTEYVEQAVSQGTSS